MTLLTLTVPTATTTLEFKMEADVSSEIKMVADVRPGKTKMDMNTDQHLDVSDRSFVAAASDDKDLGATFACQPPEVNPLDLKNGIVRPGPWSGLAQKAKDYGCLERPSSGRRLKGTQ